MSVLPGLLLFVSVPPPFEEDAAPGTAIEIAGNMPIAIEDVERDLLTDRCRSFSSAALRSSLPLEALSDEVTRQLKDEGA